ncbi:MAG TPA: hypothetical protein VFT45_17945 [Longimicrobium sp.]|nr:hypothetical protein [Longimicrobium sp.]
MSGTPADPADQGEMLLPFPPEPAKASPQGESAALPSVPDPAERPPSSPPPPRGRRGTPQVPSLPNPQEWADEVLRQVQLRQAEVTETWGDAVDLLTRQIQTEVTRLSDTSARATTEIQGAMATIDRSVSTLTQQLGVALQEVQETVEAQTEALRETVAEQGRTLAASTREAASNIGVARHELALSVAELKRRTFRHGIMLGAVTSLLILLAARILFPFWGMKRPDVEAWSRGTQLLQTYEAAPAQRREAILRALEWRAMPASTPSPPSPSGAPRADGR